MQPLHDKQYRKKYFSLITNMSIEKIDNLPFCSIKHLISYILFTVYSTKIVNKNICSSKVTIKIGDKTLNIPLGSYVGIAVEQAMSFYMSKVIGDKNNFKTDAVSSDPVKKQDYIKAYKLTAGVVLQNAQGADEFEQICNSITNPIYFDSISGRNATVGKPVKDYIIILTDKRNGSNSIDYPIQIKAIDRSNLNRPMNSAVDAYDILNADENQISNSIAAVLCIIYSKENGDSASSLTTIKDEKTFLIFDHKWHDARVNVLDKFRFDPAAFLKGTAYRKAPLEKRDDLGSSVIMMESLSSIYKELLKIVEGEFGGVDSCGAAYNTPMNTLGVGDVVPPGNNGFGSGDLFCPIFTRQHRKPAKSRKKKTKSKTKIRRKAMVFVKPTPMLPQQQ